MHFRQKQSNKLEDRKMHSCIGKEFKRSLNPPTINDTISFYEFPVILPLFQPDKTLLYQLNITRKISPSLSLCHDSDLISPGVQRWHGTVCIVGPP